MTNEHFVLFALCAGLLLACSPKKELTSHANDSTAQTGQIRDVRPMRADFMESCTSRPEYVTRARAGTVDAHCACLFDKTMRGLSVDERVVAGLYLYGETDETFLKRHKLTAPDPRTITVAVQAISNAAKSCR